MKLCERCGAPADVESHVTVRAIALTKKAEAFLRGSDAPMTAVQIYCMACVRIVGETIAEPTGGELGARGRVQ